MSFRIYIVSFIIFMSTIQSSYSYDICLKNDPRVQVPVWTPKEDKDGSFFPEAPGSDGQIIYVLLYTDMNRCDRKKKNDLISFTDSKNNSSISHVVNMRPDSDHMQITNGACYISGYFMYENVFGMHQGVVESYLTSVSKLQVAISTKFCLVRDPYRSN